jgi:hypothetical protein
MSRDREFTDIMEKNTFDLVNEKNIIGQLDSNSVSHNLHNNIIIEKDNDIERFLNI